MESSKPSGHRCRFGLFCTCLLTAIISLFTYLWPVDRKAPILITDSDGKYGYINASGRLIIEPKWTLAHPFDSEGMAVFSNNDRPTEERFGWIDKEGRVLIEPTWDLAHPGKFPNFNEFGLVAVTKDDKYGWIDRRGKAIVPLELDSTEPFLPNGRACVKIGNKFGWINAKGDLAISLEWDNIGRNPWPDPELFKGEYARVAKDGRWGILNVTSGELVVEPQWDSLNQFDSTGVAEFYEKNQYGLVDHLGNVISPAAWDEIRSFDKQGMCMVRKGQYWGWVSRDGKVTEPKWQEVSQFDANGMAMVKTNDLWGWVDTSGKSAIPAKWKNVEPFDKTGMARVQQADGTGPNSHFWGWIDQSGKILISPNWWHASDFNPLGYASVKKEGQDYWINRKGEIVIPPDWNEILEFDSYGYAAVSKQDKWGWIDRNGKVVIDLQWDWVKPFCDMDVAWVSAGGKWGAVNRIGEIVVKPEWDSYSDGVGDGIVRLVNHSESKAAIFDLASRKLKPAPGDVSAFDNNGIAWFFSLENQGLGGVIDIRGNTLFSLPSGIWWPVWTNNDHLTTTWGNLRDVMMMELDHFRLPKSELYVARKWENALTLSQEFYKAFATWFGQEKPFLPEGRVVCHAYDREGRLVWSSDWVRFETKCLVILAFGLLGAFFARPSFRGRTQCN